jgi:hypothetical protein
MVTPNTAAPPRPNENTYWVKPGLLLAGEYPADRDPAKSPAKLAAYLDAGVTAFLDLTEETELPPYEPLLMAQAAKRKLVVQYARFPVRDAGLPEAHEIGDILKRIDNWHAAGICVYVHCWGGVGRTGTVIGCYLRTLGLSGDEALAELANFWKTVSVEKRRRRPVTPETPPQAAFVRAFDPTP